jgi:ankyrin repeat protein
MVMQQRSAVATIGAIVTLFAVAASAGELADAVMHGDVVRARRLLADPIEAVDEPQVDGSTALHWAARQEDVPMARLLLDAGASIAAENRIGVTPLRLAAINGSAAMLELLLDAGAEPNAHLTPHGDTALMLTARTGRMDAIRVLLDRGADVDAVENWGGTTALTWAIAEHHPAAVRLLLEHGADVDRRSKAVPQRRGGRGVEGTAPVAYDPEQLPASYANGGFTPLHFAAREGELEAAQALLAAGAEIDAIAADGKNALGLAIYNGHYEVASLLIEAGADVNRPDAEGFPPLFWAVDRRNMEWNPGFPWAQTADPLPLIRQLLDAGADVNALIDNRPESRRNFGGSPRIKFATSLMRAAYSGDVELVKLLLDHGADPLIRNSDNETALLAASGYGWIDGYSQGRSNEERLATMRLLVERGADVNWACDHGITPLMVAANFGDTEMIQYLVDKGADLSAHDLGKKNDGIFGGSIEPLMAIDYAIGVGTFRPNNAIIHMAEATGLLTRLMRERGVAHTTSECTLRAFSCGDVDPQGSAPAQIAKTRAIQIGNQVEGVVGGLDVALDGEYRE